MNWNDFKEMVVWARELNEQIMKANKGSNSIMLSISIYDKDSNDWVEANPHSIDLRSGECTVNSPFFSNCVVLDIKRRILENEQPRE